MNYPQPSQLVTRPTDYARMLAAASPQQSTSGGSVTWSGIVLFVMTLMLAMSAFERFRIPLGPLQVHMYLVPLSVMCGFVCLARIRSFPLSTLVSGILLTAVYCASTLSGPAALSYSVKMIASATTVLTVALMVRSTNDFRLASFGLIAAMVLLSVLALLGKHESFVGANALETGNENAFSLYTLPPLLLAGWLALDQRLSLLLRGAAVGAALIIVLTLFSNANRSGWLCAGLVGLLLMGKGRVWSKVFIVLMGLSGYFLVQHFGDTSLISERFNESFTAHSTDNLRVQLFVQCFNIGLSYPILGVSPQLLPTELGRRIENYNHGIESHNLYGSLIAGSGFIAFFLLLYFGYTLFRKQAKQKVPPRATTEEKRAIQSRWDCHRLLRMMLILGVVRGSFTNEIMASPGFCFGIGLTVGLCIANGLYLPDPPTGARLPPGAPQAR